MVEIYNETIHDLLSSKVGQLEIRAQGNKIVLPGITELSVESVADIDEIIDMGQKNRTVAATKMNSER
jgi:kinesin family member C2/C3